MKRSVLFVFVMCVAAALLNPFLLSAQEQEVTHVVQAGENLYRIALRYGVDLNELARVNNITNQQRILVGQVLVVPGLSQPDATTDVVENPLIAGTPIVHVVQPGEHLTAIANSYGVTVEQILQANNIPNANRIERGQELNIWTPQGVTQAADAALVNENTVESAAPLEANMTYVVQPGEHLSQIATRYGLDWVTLAQINGITDPNTLFAGQEIVIPAVNADGGIVDMGILTAPTVGGSGYVPTPTLTSGRQIVVDLSESRVYAFEDGVLVKSALASTGLPATPTVTGDFNIWHRTEAQTMTGPGYNLPNVQWVQYFYQGYGLHGTYWHNNFGQPMSHGCVNLTNEDAEWFYNFGSLGMSVRVQY